MKFELIPPVVKNGFKNLLRPLIHLCVKLHLNPNWLTTLSFFISFISAWNFATGALLHGAWFLLLSGLFDMFDGAVARASDRVTKFGALYDSTLDRYAEIIVFAGIGYHFIGRVGQGVVERQNTALLVFIGLAGSLMVSYIRARAEGLDFECKVGLMQRPERLVMLSLGAMISERWLIYAIIAIAVFSNITAIQRLAHIWLKEKERKWLKAPSDIYHE
jgi:CDP-diacylglycerol---glycerol-3-phosphate 3-phosphatidyltransferase